MHYMKIHMYVYIIHRIIYDLTIHLSTLLLYTLCKCLKYTLLKWQNFLRFFLWNSRKPQKCTMYILHFYRQLKKVYKPLWLRRIFYKTFWDFSKPWIVKCFQNLLYDVKEIHVTFIKEWTMSLQMHFHVILLDKFQKTHEFHIIRKNPSSTKNTS